MTIQNKEALEQFTKQYRATVKPSHQRYIRTPQNILTNMTESYTLPTLEEGFDMITFYNMHGALLGIDYGEEQ